MKLFFKILFLSCFIAMFIFGDMASGQVVRNLLRERSNLRALPPQDVFTEDGVKLSVDTPLKVLQKAVVLPDDYYDQFKEDSDDALLKAANFYLGQCYLLGYNGCPKDEKKALECFEVLFHISDEGWVNIAKWEDWAFAPGKNQRLLLKPSSNESFKNLLTTYIEGIRKQAEEGDAEARYKLGIYYAIAMGVPHHPQESVKWIRQAAEQGNGDAQFALAGFYAEGYGGLRINKTEFYKWVRQAAKKGNEKAIEIVGEQ